MSLSGAADEVDEEVEAKKVAFCGTETAAFASIGAAEDELVAVLFGAGALMTTCEQHSREKANELKIGASEAQDFRKCEISSIGGVSR